MIEESLRNCYGLEPEEIRQLNAMRDTGLDSRHEKYISRETSKVQIVSVK